MRRIGLLGMMLVVVSLVGLGSEAAWMGVAFSDTYGAFAPLSLLHRGYANYLFYGGEIDVPAGVASACEQTGIALAEMHVGLLSQTGSHVVNTIPRLTRLRSDIAELCSTHSEMLDRISQMIDVDKDVLEIAAQQGLFSSIYDLQQRLQLMLDAYLEGIPSDEATWEFAVSFTLHTLLAQQELLSVDSGLRAILYGAEDATAPPDFVPADIASDIVLVVEFFESSTDEVVSEDVRDLIQLIFTYVLEKP